MQANTKLILQSTPTTIMYIHVLPSYHDHNIVQLTQWQ